MAPNNTTNETINPNDDLKIPEWINEEYFEPIVAADVPEYKKIIKFTPIAATAPGENYTSIMVRVIMELKMKDGSQIQKSYILKTELSYANESTKFLNVMCLFPKELLMYKDILPQLVKLYKEAGVEVQLAPKCLHVEQTPEKMTLVMEDLSQYGFENVDRLKGFDMEHMIVVLEKLAELHAATARLHELNGPYDPMFNLSLYAESNREMFRMVDKSRRETTKKAMRQWGLENAEYFIEKMPTIDEVFDEGQLVNHVDPTEFNVLNHGDCWSNNIMFIHDKQSGEVKQTMFIDYQICKWGSPAQDLWYMITTSASLDIKVKEFDRFIYIYHKRLVECLKLLNYGKKVPSLKDIHIMMIKYGQWGPLTANGVMTAVLLPTDKDASMENLLKDGPEAEGFKIRSLTNPYYAKAMCQLYPFFDRKGLLDYSS